MTTSVRNDARHHNINNYHTQQTRHRPDDSATNSSVRNQSHPKNETKQTENEVDNLFDEYRMNRDGAKPTVDSQAPNSNQPTDHASEDLEAKLDKLLPQGGELNEEQVYAALVELQLGEMDPQLASIFAANYKTLLSDLTRNGHAPVELAVDVALKALVDAGGLTPEQGIQLKSTSHRAAQLDSNHDKLYDSKGDTSATASREQSLTSASETLKKVLSGEVSFQPQPLEPNPDVSFAPTTSSGAAGGTSGFVWKPVSESDGKLVVLLPPSFRGNVAQAEIHSELPPSDETRIEEGRFTGDTHNGNRPHFRFSKPGSGYGSGLYLVAYDQNGEYQHWEIENGGSRVG